MNDRILLYDSRITGFLSQLMAMGRMLSVEDVVLGAGDGIPESVVRLNKVAKTPFIAGFRVVRMDIFWRSSGRFVR